MVPELISLSLEKALPFFQCEVASVSTKFYYISSTAAPAVTKLPSITKTSVDGLVVQPELIIPRKITHFQFLETYLSLSREGQIQISPLPNATLFELGDYHL